MPSRDGIAPYAYKGGIEVWLAESGGKDPGHSDFWRAEPSGRFSLFRGYQEDGTQFPRGKTNVLDIGLVLWRTSEVLLYLESLADVLEVPTSGADLCLAWSGLDGRQLTQHKSFHGLYSSHVSHQDSVRSHATLPDASRTKQVLIETVHAITQPLFETFAFFKIDPEAIQAQIRELFDREREVPPS